MPVDCFLTKKLLVPSASTTPLGTPQPGSRPRLVAKTTSGMRDSISKTGIPGAKPSGTGPDPNQVWNKNRRRSSSAKPNGIVLTE